MQNQDRVTSIYFTSVAALANDFVVLGGHLYSEETTPTTTRFFVCHEGKWFHYFDFDEVVYSLARVRSKTPGLRDSLLVMGRAGHFREITQGQRTIDEKLDILDAGYLMSMRHLDDRLFVCGIQDIVYRRSGGQWERIDASIFQPTREVADRGLAGIDGFSDKDVYAVGLHGAILHWNGDSWTALDSPVKTSLRCVKCSSDGYVYVGGSGGVLLRGNAAGWTNLTNRTVANGSFERMAEFGGKLYVAGIDKLIRTEGPTIEEVYVPLEGPKSFYALDATETQLWCVGDQSILKFDGRTWERHVCPDNRSKDT